MIRMSTLDAWLSARQTEFGMPYTTPVTRLRAASGTDRYGNATADWTHADSMQIDAYIATAPYADTWTGEQARREELDTARLVAPAGTDIAIGDRIRRDSDGKTWYVVDAPSSDTNPFTGWRPTTTAYLKEWKG